MGREWSRSNRAARCAADLPRFLRGHLEQEGQHHEIVFARHGRKFRAHLRDIGGRFTGLLVLLAWLGDSSFVLALAHLLTPDLWE